MPEATLLKRLDNAPSPRGFANALAAQNLVRLALLTGNDAWREKVDRLFDGVLSIATR